MTVPARRFQPPTAAATPVPVPVPVPAGQPRQPITVGPTETTRRVSASGLIGVCYPAGLSRPAPRRPDRHRPAPPKRAPGLLRRPAHPHRATPQHQGGGPSPRPPTPPAKTTTHDHLGTCQSSPETTPEASTETGHPAWPSMARASAPSSGSLDRTQLAPPVHCCPRTNFGSSVKRTAKPHPLWQVAWRAAPGGCESRDGEVVVAPNCLTTRLAG